MSRALHAWRVLRSQDTWESWCGASWSILTEQHAREHEGQLATCLHCLKAQRDQHLWRAEHSAEKARSYTAAVDAEVRKRSRARRRRST